MQLNLIYGVLSRVGRKFPGLVFTVCHWARPRDLSHYETFEHYHATFYKHVEALSVTPFALGAISRGLTALLVSCIRLQGTEFNANQSAGRIERNHPYIQAAVEMIARRAHLVGNGAEIEQLVRGELNERLDQWLSEAQKTVSGRILGYDEQRDGLTGGGIPMSRSGVEKRRVGDLRPSQLLHPFGVGSVVELPNLSVMVMGLED